MEKDSSVSVYSRTNTSRSLLKKTFKNPLFSLVPFEIWRDLIVMSAFCDLHSVAVLSQTCFAFKELIDIIGENNLHLAFSFRKQDQIPLARKFLLKCAENNNLTAMFHLAYAYSERGWGLKLDWKMAFEWFKKSAELGFAPSMAGYARCLIFGLGVEKDYELGQVWMKKALLSGDHCAVGFCYFWDLKNSNPRTRGYMFANFEVSAKEGNEFSQCIVGCCFFLGSGVEKNFDEAHCWFKASAEQGYAKAQFYYGKNFIIGKGCEKDIEKGIIWLKKAKNQGENESIDLLKTSMESLNKMKQSEKE